MSWNLSYAPRIYIYIYIYIYIWVHDNLIRKTAIVDNFMTIQDLESQLLKQNFLSIS